MIPMCLLLNTQTTLERYLILNSAVYAPSIFYGSYVYSLTHKTTNDYSTYSIISPGIQKGSSPVLSPIDGRIWFPGPSGQVRYMFSDVVSVASLTGSFQRDSINSFIYNTNANRVVYSTGNGSGYDLRLTQINSSSVSVHSTQSISFPGVVLGNYGPIAYSNLTGNIYAVGYDNSALTGTSSTHIREIGGSSSTWLSTSPTFSSTFLSGDDGFYRINNTGRYICISGSISSIYDVVNKSVIQYATGETGQRCCLTNNYAYVSSIGGTPSSYKTTIYQLSLGSTSSVEYLSFTSSSLPVPLSLEVDYNYNQLIMTEASFGDKTYILTNIDI